MWKPPFQQIYDFLWHFYDIYDIFDYFCQVQITLPNYLTSCESKQDGSLKYGTL